MREDISAILEALPPATKRSLRPEIRQRAAESGRKLVVLDDDPTGTQTVYNIPVLTQWDVATLEAELLGDFPCFYILTNSRSLTPDATSALHHELAANLVAAQRATGRTCTVFSRSDSTLRGHFPLETNVLNEKMGPFDSTFIVPYFEAGGRVTVEDVHYVVENGNYTPAAETAFAKDSVFGYEASNLRDWVAEKSDGSIAASQVESISLSTLRGPMDTLLERILAIPKGSYAIVNAIVPSDVEAFALASLKAEEHGRRFLFRSAASIVAARLGLEPQPLWRPDPSHSLACTPSGGLVIVGSHVAKTSEQLQVLLDTCDIESLEINVSKLLSDQRQQVMDTTTAHMLEYLKQSRNVVAHTSRKLITGHTQGESLAIGQLVSDALVEIVRHLNCTPRFLIAKGGITSSDIATNGLNVQRAMVLGQILPGVPVWELGAETRFPQMPYVVFPGNVGGKHSLAEAVTVFEKS